MTTVTNIFSELTSVAQRTLRHPEGGAFAKPEAILQNSRRCSRMNEWINEWTNKLYLSCSRGKTVDYAERSFGNT